MSDFDKEAEREKLREKYERDEQKREATEQMSELLLKGATMTNAHCSDCGDPIFRYEGQEFCPTCQKAVERDGDAEDAPDETANGATESVDEDGTAADGPDETAAAADVPDASDDTAASADAGSDEDASRGQPGEGDHIEVTAPSDDARVQFGSDGAEETATHETADHGAADRQSTPEQSPAAGADTSPRANRRRAQQNPQTRTPEPGNRPASGERQQAGAPDASASEHLQRANVVLARTVERFARHAEAADSPREAREHLEAAREAAETLEASPF